MRRRFAAQTAMLAWIGLLTRAVPILVVGAAVVVLVVWL